MYIKCSAPLVLCSFSSFCCSGELDEVYLRYFSKIMSALGVSSRKNGSRCVLSCRVFGKNFANTYSNYLILFERWTYLFWKKIMGKLSCKRTDVEKYLPNYFLGGEDLYAASPLYQYMIAVGCVLIVCLTLFMSSITWSGDKNIQRDAVDRPSFL